MPELGPAPQDRPSDGTKTFRFSFSFGSRPEQIRQAVEAARAAGVEPQVEEHVFEFKPLELLERLEGLKERDPLRRVRRIMAWLPAVLFFSALFGGIVLGCFEPTLGPYWGGIFGAVLGGFAYQMFRPYRLHRWL